MMREGTNSGTTSSGQCIHPSLVRPELTLGVERQVAGVEATLCFALLFGARLSIATVSLVAIVVVVIHPVMVWLTAKDPEVTQIYARSRQYADFYAPHSTLWRTPRAPRPSLPRVR
jgi:type IV secretory pathway TrbD component